MTPNDKLPEEVRQKIEYDAHKYYKGNSDSHHPSNFKYIDGYIAGATTEAVKAEAAIDAALHAERNAIQTKMTAMETGYLKQMQRMADALEGAIEQMKEYEQVFNVPFGTSIINGETALQQFKDGKGKEAGNDA